MTQIVCCPHCGVRLPAGGSLQSPIVPCRKCKREAIIRDNQEWEMLPACKRAPLDDRVGPAATVAIGGIVVAGVVYWFFRDSSWGVIGALFVAVAAVCSAVSMAAEAVKVARSKRRTADPAYRAKLEALGFRLGDAVPEPREKAKPKTLAEITHHGSILVSALSPDGRCGLTASREKKTVRLWDAETGRRLLQLEGHAEEILSAAFSPDGGRVLAGGADGVGYLWDAANGALQRRLTGTDGGVTAVTFAPDGRRALTGHQSGTVRVWDLDSGSAVLEMKPSDDAQPVRAVAFSADGREVVAADAGQLRRWDAETGALTSVAESSVPAGWTVLVALSPDGRWLLRILQEARSPGRGGEGGQPVVFDTRTGQLHSKLPARWVMTRGAAFTPDGKTVALCGDNNIRLDFASAYLWDVEADEELTSADYIERSLRFSAQSIAVSADGRRLLTGAIDGGKTTFWDSGL